MPCGELLCNVLSNTSCFVDQMHPKSCLLYKKKKSIRVVNKCSLKSGVPSCNLQIGKILRHCIQVAIILSRKSRSTDTCMLVFVSIILKDACLWLKLWYFGQGRQRCYSRISCNKRVKEETVVLIIRDAHRSVSIEFWVKTPILRCRRVRISHPFSSYA